MMMIIIMRKRDFPGSPVVRTAPSNAAGVGLIPGWELRPTCPLCQRKKKLKYKTEAVL